MVSPAPGNVSSVAVTAEDDGDLALGCAFVQPLSESQQRTLGLLDETAGGPGWGEATLQHVAREGGCWVIGCATSLQASDASTYTKKDALILLPSLRWQR